jgi:HK97 family phage prohead protease
MHEIEGYKMVTCFGVATQVPVFKHVESARGRISDEITTRRTMLTGTIQRLLPKVAGSQRRRSLENIQHLLITKPQNWTPSLLDEVERVVDIAGYLASAEPSQSRSMQLPAQTRAGSDVRTITFVASSDTLDRHGTRILPMGIDTSRYESNPIVLWGHDGYGGFSKPDAENVIGKAVRLRKTDKRLEADVQFLPAEVNPKAEMVLGMVRAGAVSAVSIGFIPREIIRESDDSGREIPVIRRSELLEISVVPIPSNPDALATRSRVSESVIRDTFRLALFDHQRGRSKA